VSTVLAFDCAVSGQGVAIVRDGVSLATLFEEGRDQAARLLPAIAATLGQAGIARTQLDLVAVTIGPGSFTGVRVGLSAARGLAVGLGIPLAGVATTTVLRAQATSADRLAVAAVDTRLGDWFCAIGEDQAPFAATSAELAARLAGRRCLIVGRDVAPLAASLLAAGIDAVAQEGPPDPVVLGRRALVEGVESWRARNHAEGLPRPLYLRGVNITLPDGARRTVE
jgi:tRNA threonylcarbamoyladenosine biosynthesis protein TsaB